MLYPLIYPLFYWLAVMLFYSACSFEICVATLLTPYKGDLYNIDTNPWQRMMTFEADYY